MGVVPHCLIPVRAYNNLKSSFVDTGSYENWLMIAVSYEETDGIMFDDRPLSALSPVWTPIPG